MTTGANISVDLIVPIFYLPELYLIIKKCLDSIKENYPDFNLITIDDSIGDYPFECTYKNIENLGYVKSVNLGLKKSTADVIIVFNDDLEVIPNSLDNFLTLKDNVIASVQDSAGTNDELFGCNFGMTRKTLEKIGYLDERFKHFFADRNYFERAVKLGIEVIKWRDIVLPHHESATYNKLDKEKLLLKDQKIFLS